MSTRCQIAFIAGAGEHRAERWVYRHSDGYPGDGTVSEWGVLYDLKAFIAWNAGRMSDVEYCAANFLFWSKYQSCGYVVNGAPSGDWEDVPPNLVGFGVCTPGEFHDDVEYFYEVITDEVGSRIVAYAVECGSGDEPVTRACLRRLCEVRGPP